MRIKLFTITTTLLFLLCLSLTVGNHAMAAAEITTNQTCDASADAVWPLRCIFPIAANVISYLIALAGLVAIILIIYSGIRFMTSNGDPKQIDGAKKNLTYALLGLFLAFASFAIIVFISNATGVACISLSKVISTTPPANPFETCN